MQKTEGEGLVHLGDVLSTQGRQKRGGVPNGKNKLQALSCSFCSKRWNHSSSNVCEVENIPLLFQNEECMCEMCSFNRGGPLPSSVYLGRHNVIHLKKSPRPSPPFLHTASDEKLDGGKA